MNPKTTLFLLIALAVIGAGFFFLFPRGEVPIDDDTEGTQKSLFSLVELDPAGLRTIDVTWEGDRAVTLERDLDGNWLQVAPVRFPLHRVKMELGVLNPAATLMYTDRFVAGEEGKPTLEQTGIDQPSAVITFKGVWNKLDPTGKAPVESKPYEQRIKIGKTTVGGRAYIQLNDAPDIYVVNRDLHDVLLRDPIREWRIKKLDGPSEAQAKRITLNVEDETFSLRKSDDGDWAFEEPHSGRVHPYAPKALVEALDSVKVGRFEEDSAENMALFGLDKPRVSFTVETPQLSIKKRTLRIGGPADANGVTYYATWSQEESENRVVFTILKSDRAKFMPKTNELRDPRITLFRPSDVRAIKVRRGNLPVIELEKSSVEGWVFAKSPDAPKFGPDGASVGRLIEAMTEATVHQYVANASQDGKPLAIVVLNAGPTKDSRLQVFEAPSNVTVVGGQKVYMVLLDDERTGYLIKQEQLAPLFEPVIKLRDREVLALDIKKMRRIVVRRWDGVQYEFVGVVNPQDVTNEKKVGNVAPAKWLLAGYDELEANAFGQLLHSLMKIRCESWLAEPAKIGKEKVEIEVIFTDMAPIKLTFDANTREANMVGLPYGFTLPQHMHAIALSEFRYRSVLPIAAHDIETVTVQAKDAKAITMRRDDVGRFNAIGPDGQRVPGIKLNFAVAAKLYDVLSPLRVDRYTKKLNFDPKDAMLTITIVTKTRKTHVVHMGFGEKREIGVIGDQWFTVDQATASKLFSDSTKPAAQPTR